MRKHTLLYLPQSGLFFGGREFTDGDGNTITWNRTLPIFPNHYVAEQAKGRILARYPQEYSRGRIIVLNVDLTGKAEDVNIFEQAGNWPEL